MSNKQSLKVGVNIMIHSLKETSLNKLKAFLKWKKTFEHFGIQNVETFLWRVLKWQIAFVFSQTDERGCVVGFADFNNV